MFMPRSLKFGEHILLSIWGKHCSLGRLIFLPSAINRYLIANSWGLWWGNDTWTKLNLTPLLPLEPKQTSCINVVTNHKDNSKLGGSSTWRAGRQVPAYLIASQCPLDQAKLKEKLKKSPPTTIPWASYDWGMGELQKIADLFWVVVRQCDLGQ